MTRGLLGRRAVVTGGGSGIGRACALRLAADGANVAVLDLREGAADQVAAAIREGGGRAVALVFDVSAAGEMAEAMDRAAAELDGLDTVVTCAGVLSSGATHETDVEQWERVLRINLTGTFLAVRYGLPHLLAAGNGSIVTIGSVASVVAGGAAASYDASKAGVAGFTRSLAAEYAASGIRANCVCPGAVATDLRGNTEAVLGAATAPLLGSRGVRVQVPMTRRADPSEIAGVVAFLCSGDASFVTGATVMVDGGLTAV